MPVRYRRKAKIRKRIMAGIAGGLALLLTGSVGTELIVDYTQTTSQAAGTFTKDTSVAKISDFPASYQPYLEAIQEVYPNAVFVKYDTGLEWSEAFTTDNLSYPSRNMVINNSTTPSSWKSTESGYFDWVNNDWVTLAKVNDGTTLMVEASQEILAYYFDPRAYLDPIHVFAMETEAFDSSVQTVAGVESILKGTFMEGVKIKEYDATGTATGKSLTYAKAIYNIGKKTGVSPYLIAARIRQEQGCDGSGAMISGTVSGYKGLYNYMDIETYDSEDINQVITFSMIEAKTGSDFDNDSSTANVSWTSPYLAIWGGCIKLASNYITNGRNNLYLQKFDVVQRYTSSGYAYRDYYGYETYLIGSYSESQSLYYSYLDNDMITKDSDGTVHSDLAFAFEIPVYDNMPDECVCPTKDGNPNYKLSNIKLDGGSYSIGTFKTDTKTYSAIVPYSCETIKVSAYLYASTSTVKINGTVVGTSGTTGRSGKVALDVGSNTVKVQVIAENGDKRTYTLTIERQEKTEEQVVANPKLSSDTYTISGGYISNLTVGVKAKAFLANLTAKDGSVKLVDADGKSVSNSTKMASGMQVQLYNANDELYKTYKVVIYGDVNSDGAITARDILAVKRHILEIKSLSGADLKAADVNDDGSVTARDILAIKRDILGITSITQR